MGISGEAQMNIETDAGLPESRDGASDSSLEESIGQLLISEFDSNPDQQKLFTEE